MTDTTPSTPHAQVNALDALRIGLVLILAVAQIAAGVIGFVAGWEETVASRSNANPTLITPASYAFSIWGLIFLGCVVYALYQAWPSNRTNPHLRRAGWLAVLAFSANTAWQIYTPLYGFGWPSLAIILIIPVSMLVLIHGLNRRTKMSRWTRAVLAPLFLLGGWGTAAASVNLLITLDWEGWVFVEVSDLTLALSCLSLVVVTAALTAWRCGAPDYIAGVVWALVAIIVANSAAGGNDVVMYAAGSAAILLAVMTIFRGFRRI
ncbi:MAG: seryl-tRNA synthetase [Hyphobacterium sp.]|nr:MAG: seryl-tRNA synthetase [Hyphobacterium sp.]